MDHNDLPIQKIYPIFCQKVEKNERVVVVAPTGSGKSTQLPLWLAQKVSGRVLVVEPRRVACRALAEYVASSLGEEVGGRVGYRVRFESKVSAETQVEFVTPGVALRVLQGAGFSKYDAFLLDEFHERSWELDVLVAALSLALKSVPRPFVMTSATLAGKELAERLDASLLEAQGRTFPVSISYLNEPAEPTIVRLEERVVSQVKAILQASGEGDVLVFLPGKGEIERCRQALLSSLASEFPDVLWVPVHGSLPMEQLSRALSNKELRRRVYLSTNLAETSLTLPRVTVVLDSGLARMRIHRGGQSALALVPIAESLMEQRAGRAGRVAPGRCIRLWRENFRAKAHRSAEIERIELDDFSLAAASFELLGKRASEVMWVSEPPPFALEAAIERLRRMGALTEELSLTKLGRQLAQWPISSHQAFLLQGAPPPLLSVLVDIVALLQQHGDLMLPLHALSKARQDEVREERERLLEGCQNEVYTQVLLLRKGNARKHGLHGSGLQQVRSIAKQLRRFLKLSDTRGEERFPSTGEVASWVLSRLPQLGFVLRQRARRAPLKKKRSRHPNPRLPWTNGEIEVEIEPFLSLEDGKPVSMSAGILFAHTWVGERGLKVTGRGRMLLPCEESVLAKEGLGTVEFDEPKMIRSGDSFRVLAQVRRTISNVTIAVEEEELSGSLLREALIPLFLRGSWWKDGGEMLLDELHLLRLLSEWPEPKEWSSFSEARAWHLEPALFLGPRLESLGIEECEDLELVDLSDLCPDLTELLGMYAFQIEEFRRDFPRRWEILGRLYTCEIRPRSRVVVLQPLNSAAKKGKDPELQTLPNFRGFRVEYQRASRRISLRS